MTGSDVRQMDNDKIQAEIARLSGKLYDLRSQTVTEKVEDVSQFGKVRKDIARLLTERTSRIKAGKWAVGSKK
jgi:large subunit ribosomal protein L29